MLINKVKAENDLIIDTQTNTVIAKCFGSIKRAILITEIINDFVDNQPDLSNIKVASSEEEAAAETATAPPKKRGRTKKKS